MAREILDTLITGPYWVDGGDIVVVTKDAIVRSDAFNTGAIDNRTGSDAGISILVDGKIHNKGEYGSGILLDGQTGDDSGGHLIELRDGGLVSAYHGISLIHGQESTVTVHGTLRAEHTGILAEIGSVSIDISGKVRGGSSCVTLFSAGDSTITNSGRLTGGTGVYIQDSDSSSILNTGKITTGFGGIASAQSDDLTIVNKGVIDTAFDTWQSGESTYYSSGIELSWANGLRLENHGRIESGYAINLADSTGTIVNSGKLIGQKMGIFLGSHGVGPDSLMTILNTGAIRAEISLYAYDGPLHVTNTGLMKGQILANDAQTTLINGGRIIGTVKLSNFDDLYRGVDDGFVSAFVNGGGGQDRLIGASRTDRLRGGGDDDILRGKGGADVLKGGAGDDILHGGAGADVFVFGPQGGRDRIVDFQDGQDMLRISGHSGGFATLGIVDQGGDLHITHDGGVIVLEGQAGVTLGLADFDFG